MKHYFALCGEVALKEAMDKATNRLEIVFFIQRSAKYKNRLMNILLLAKCDLL